jgi:hypothetical protein
MFVRRGAGGPGNHLQLRLVFFVVGATLAVAGMAMTQEWLMNVAIGVLGVGFVLRFVPERGGSRGDGGGNGGPSGA